MSIRKILRFLVYSLVVLGALLCGMDVAFGQAEQVVGIIYGIGLWVLILKVIHALLDKMANANATSIVDIHTDDDRPRLHDLGVGCSIMHRRQILRNYLDG